MTLAQAQALLAADPEDLRALVVMGQDAMACGVLDRAEALYRRALAADTMSVAANLGLAEVMTKTGQYGAAVRAYRQVLVTQPDHPAALRGLGTASLKAGDVAEAIETFMTLLRIEPNDVGVLNNLSVALRAADRLDEAVTILGTALSIAPRSTEVMINLANLLRVLGRLGEAHDLAAEAIALKPADPDLHNNLSSILLAQGRFEDACAAAEKAIALDPGHQHAHNNMGMALEKQGALKAALRSFAAAVEIDPSAPRALNNYGSLLFATGRLEEARAALQTAHAKLPHEHSIQLNLGLLELMQGDLVPGWQHYEARFQTPGVGPQRVFSMARWQGEPLAGKRVLVWREQGIGDEFWFVQCLVDVSSQAAAVVYETEPRMVPVLARSFPQVLVRAETAYDGTQTGLFDYHISVGSLMAHYRAHIDAFPTAPGYLRPDPERSEAFRMMLERLGPRPWIGLSWRSGITANLRSPGFPALKDWRALLTRTDITIVNLQYGDILADLRSMREFGENRPAVLPGLDTKNDLDGVLALMSQLDAVVAVNNAVAEMAGAVGAPCHMISNNLWTGLGTPRRPGYPNTTCHLIEEGKIWADCVEQATAALAQYLDRGDEPV